MLDKELCADVRSALCNIPPNPQVREIMAMDASDAVLVRDFMKSPKSYIKLYPKVLMACVRDQLKLLCYLYPHYYADDTVLTAWAVLINRGYFPTVLNDYADKDRATVERFMLVHAGITAALENADDGK